MIKVLFCLTVRMTTGFTQSLPLTSFLTVKNCGMRRKMSDFIRFYYGLKLLFYKAYRTGLDNTKQGVGALSGTRTHENVIFNVLIINKLGDISVFYLLDMGKLVL